MKEIDKLYSLIITVGLSFDKNDFLNGKEYNSITMEKDKAYDLYSFRAQFLEDKKEVYCSLQNALQQLNNSGVTDIVLHGLFIKENFHLFFTDQSLQTLIAAVNFGESVQVSNGSI